MTKSWQEKALEKELSISASQITTKRRCMRQWWFEKVRRLPTEVIKGGVFGSVLHAVCERYLLADDLGRDAKGQPVNLYPPGWEISYDKNIGLEEGRVTPAEQDVIRSLIHKAIEEGVLERLPQRKIEHEFDLGIGEFEVPSGGECLVIMIGFIDVMLPGEVQDHKTSKDKKWFLSKAKLKTNCQMLIYAYYVIKRIKEQGGSVPKTIKLRHNQYCKDPVKPSIRKTEVEVKTVDVLAHWKQVENDAKEMVLLRDSTVQYFDIPDPEDQQKTCRAYGGCPFLTICFGRESPEVYEERMTRYISHKTKTVPIKETQTMPSPFATKLAKTSAVNPPLAAVTTPAPAAVIPVVAPVEEVITVDVIATWPEKRAPWAQDKDPANGGCGFNDQGQPSQVSDMMSKQAGGYTSDMFLIYAPINGLVPVQGKPGTPAEPLRLRCPMTATPVAAVAVTTAVAPVSEEMTMDNPTGSAFAAAQQAESDALVDSAVAESEANAAAAPAQEEPDETPQVARSTGTKKVGRSGKSFMLMLGISSAYGRYRPGSGRHVYDAFQMFEDVKQAVAEDNGAENFEDLDVWKRRDMIRSKGAIIADSLKTDILQVAATNISPDMQAFIDAVRPFAGSVFVGTNY